MRDAKSWKIWSASYRDKTQLHWNYTLSRGKIFWLAEHESKNLEDQNTGITWTQKVSIEKDLACLFTHIFFFTYFSFVLGIKKEEGESLKRKIGDELKYK